MWWSQTTRVKRQQIYSLPRYPYGITSYMQRAVALIHKPEGSDTLAGCIYPSKFTLYNAEAERFELPTRFNVTSFQD